MASDTNPAIELLVAQIDELERKANAYRVSVNVLCEKDGRPPLYPGAGKDGGASSVAPSRESPSIPTQITSDIFYGQPQQTAIRKLLSIRKAAGDGPAKPAQILEGLRAGGYQVEAKTDDIALVGIRALLRKRNTIFHKLPNGTWGLKEWYPNAKPAKEAAEKGTTEKAGLDVKSPPIKVPDIEVEAETNAADTTEASAA